MGTGNVNVSGNSKAPNEAEKASEGDEANTKSVSSKKYFRDKLIL